MSTTPDYAGLLRERARFREAIIKIDKIAFYEKSDADLDRSVAECLEHIASEIATAKHEASCCDDIKLDQSIADIISELQTDRECLRKDAAAAWDKCEERRVQAEAAEERIRTLLERNAELERELEMWREVKHSSCWKTRAEAAEARVKELETERDEFRSKLSETIGKLMVAEAKLAEAMKVIEPFAEAAGAMDSLHGPDLSDTTRVRPGIYMGELRAARKFLKENGNGE